MEGRWVEEDRDEEPGTGAFGFGFGAGRSTTTFSILILGGSTLNLLFFPPNRRMASVVAGKAGWLGRLGIGGVRGVACRSLTRRDAGPERGAKRKNKEKTKKYTDAKKVNDFGYRESEGWVVLKWHRGWMYYRAE